MQGDARAEQGSGQRRLRFGRPRRWIFSVPRLFAPRSTSTRQLSRWSGWRNTAIRAWEGEDCRGYSWKTATLLRMAVKGEKGSNKKIRPAISIRHGTREICFLGSIGVRPFPDVLGPLRRRRCREPVLRGDHDRVCAARNFSAARLQDVLERCLSHHFSVVMRACW